MCLFKLTKPNLGFTFFKKLGTGGPRSAYKPFGSEYNQKNKEQLVSVFK
jgi:hypothetical protein